MALTVMGKSSFPAAVGREEIGYVEFTPLDVLVETLGRLLDRWICSSGSLFLRLWAEWRGKENKT